MLTRINAEIDSKGNFKDFFFHVALTSSQAYWLLQFIDDYNLDEEEITRIFSARDLLTRTPQYDLDLAYNYILELLFLLFLGPGITEEQAKLIVQFSRICNVPDNKLQTIFKHYEKIINDHRKGLPDGDIRFASFEEIKKNALKLLSD